MRDLVVAAILAALCLWAAAVLAERAVAPADALPADRPSGTPRIAPAQRALPGSKPGG